MYKDNRTEKVSVNMNISTLSYIDLLVDNGFYSNRSDFINHAVRECLSSQNKTIDRIIDANAVKEDNTGIPSKSWFVGICNISSEYLEKVLQQGVKLKISGYGMLVISKDCEEELVYNTVDSISIRGKIICSENIKKYYNL